MASSSVHAIVCHACSRSYPIDPVVPVCGHALCYKCYKQSVVCATCFFPLQQPVLPYASMYPKEWSVLKTHIVPCGKHYRGCSWIGKYADLAVHEALCPTNESLSMPVTSTTTPPTTSPNTTTTTTGAFDYFQFNDKPLDRLVDAASVKEDDDANPLQHVSIITTVDASPTTSTSLPLLSSSPKTLIISTSPTTSPYHRPKRVDTRIRTLHIACPYCSRLFKPGSSIRCKCSCFLPCCVLTIDVHLFCFVLFFF